MSQLTFNAGFVIGSIGTNSLRRKLKDAISLSCWRRDKIIELRARLKSAQHENARLRKALAALEVEE